MGETLASNSQRFFKSWSQYKSSKASGNVEDLSLNGGIKDVSPILVESETSLEKISVAIGKVFEALEAPEHHTRLLSEFILDKHTVLEYIAIFSNKDSFNDIINQYFLSLQGALKLTSASNTISLFKKLKQITLTVIFTTTRNFSIHKNLSISA
ncbi:hypothetical protein [Acinetobacter baumannii]|uniref:hypothetical protein n=1 Tax=Acinetobacter baumannii TaxID=470 RepID=UPI0005A92A05|nr:hypothetical protein [Acinetobacter baumannii]EKV2267785.1 hypothetical protein [Acinetobacter baumannii]MBC6801909.1 hypothetical protein [Acinetobacter baumannii]MBO2812320.1 hypothetical protein [Acinetobacter baumannii]MBO2871386.1 hypothetical protein [Acinetobacter baumannii]MBO3001731.1 hypothetical protein [Acinetobacter baumannii]